MSAQANTHHAQSGSHHNDIIYPQVIPFLFVHLACLGALFTGVTRDGLILCAALYLVRMFAVTAGYHRYFSHRTFKTSRPLQFLLAALCQTSTQQGVVWWAAKHREHHRHADTELDVHSPRLSGFLFSHVGWIFSRSKQQADLKLVPDLTRYPELMWLNRYHKVPAVLLALATFLAAGWQGLVVGFFFSTVLLYHGTFFINSLAHVVGRQRYVTGDDSRNNWWLALITLGEGWHNNHHHYQGSTRQGFRWWEIDITYYLLKALSWVGVVSDLKEPPTAVIRGDRPLPRPVIEKVARRLALSFPLESIGERVQAAWDKRPDLAELHLPSVHLPDLAELRRSAQAKRAQAEALLAELHLPELPSLGEIKQRAQQMFAHSPSLDEIVERARQIILETVSSELLSELFEERLPAPA